MPPGPPTVANHSSFLDKIPARWGQELMFTDLSAAVRCQGPRLRWLTPRVTSTGLREAQGGWEDVPSRRVREGVCTGERRLNGVRKGTLPSAGGGLDRTRGTGRIRSVLEPGDPLSPARGQGPPALPDLQSLPGVPPPACRRQTLGPLRLHGRESANPYDKPPLTRLSTYRPTRCPREKHTKRPRSARAWSQRRNTFPQPRRWP